MNIDITNRDYIQTVDYLRRLEAMDILHDVQTSSVKNGKESFCMDDIDAEIAAYKKEKGSITR